MLLTKFSERVSLKLQLALRNKSLILRNVTILAALRTHVCDSTESINTKNLLVPKSYVRFQRARGTYGPVHVLRRTNEISSAAQINTAAMKSERM